MATRRMRIGTLFTLLPRRGPWQLAPETRALDHPSDGGVLTPNPRIADTILMAAPVASTRGRSSSLLTEREFRGIHFSERHPWLPYAATALVWLLAIGGSVFNCSALLAHGAELGFANGSDLWRFGMGGWRDAEGPFSAFHLLVLETIDESTYQLAGALVTTVFVYCAHQQNRLIHKLKRALDES